MGKKQKPQFLTPLKTQDLNRNEYFLLEEFRFYSAILKAIIVVPKGLVCDGTSDLLKDDSKGPATLHDYGYRAPDHKIDIVNGDFLVPVYIAKTTIDRIFLESMKVWKVPTWKRWMKYLGVVTGGGESYRTGPSRFKKVDI